MKYPLKFHLIPNIIVLNLIMGNQCIKKQSKGKTKLERRKTLIEVYYLEADVLYAKIDEIEKLAVSEISAMFEDVKLNEEVIKESDIFGLWMNN